MIMIIAVNLIGLALIGIIIWWFLITKPKAKQVMGNSIDIIVQDGVYEPSIIKAKKGQKLELCFLRKDETPCSEVVVFDALNVSAELPINQPHSITLQLDQTGEFDFTCQMGMYRGKLIVE